MMTDPIIEELHQIREQLAAKFNYELHAIVADIQAREKTEDRTIVSFANSRLFDDDHAPTKIEERAERDRCVGFRLVLGSRTP